MINDHKRWLYSKSEKARIFDAGEEIVGEWYDSPAFDDQRTSMVCADDHDMKVEIERVEPTKEKIKEVDIIRPGSALLEDKYPSQLNKTELEIVCSDLGIVVNEDSTKKQMLSEVYKVLKKDG